MNMDQTRMPLLEALIDQQSREKVSVHVPGHKRGRGFLSAFARYIGPLAHLDATEVPGLDDLFCPSGPIAEAQQLASQAFASDQTYFLVGGSTSGNLAAILATVKRDDLVIVARNAHQSVWNALDLVGARRIAVMPVVKETGLVGELAPATVTEAVRRFPEASTIIVTSPTYHGFVSDIERIVDIAHRAEMTIIVDEAHGVHLPFHPGLPPSAITAHADLVVQSAHKMAAALTQTGLLHVCGDRVDPARLIAALRVVQSSSPSYVLMASIDAVRSQLATAGESLIARALRVLQAGRERLAAGCPGLLYGGQNPDFGLDPFKWTLLPQHVGMDGWKLAETLRKKYGIYVELANDRHVLLAWSYATSGRDVERVTEALCDLQTLPSDEQARLNEAFTGVASVVSPVLSHSYDLSQRSAAWRALREAAGMQALEPITVYPPGIPLILPGEQLLPRHIDILTRVLENGQRVDGVRKEGEWLVHCLTDGDS